MDQMISTNTLKRLRQERSWTQEHLAEVSGVSLRTVQRIEREGTCSLDSLQGLAAAFGIDAKMLMVDDAEKKRNRHYRRVLIWSYLGTTLGWLTGFAGISYAAFIKGSMSGLEAGIYFGVVAGIGGFSYIFIALFLEYCRKHRVGEWQNNI